VPVGSILADKQDLSFEIAGGKQLEKEGEMSLNNNKINPVKAVSIAVVLAAFSLGASGCASMNPGNADHQTTKKDKKKREPIKGGSY
jgi:hypothetical protein